MMQFFRLALQNPTENDKKVRLRLVLCEQDFICCELLNSHELSELSGAYVEAVRVGDLLEEGAGLEESFHLLRVGYGVVAFRPHVVLDDLLDVLDGLF
jgi:hypothetical protein